MSLAGKGVIKWQNEWCGVWDLGRGRAVQPSVIDSFSTSFWRPSYGPGTGWMPGPKWGVRPALCMRETDEKQVSPILGWGTRTGLLYRPGKWLLRWVWMPGGACRGESSRRVKSSRSPAQPVGLYDGGLHSGKSRGS